MLLEMEDVCIRYGDVQINRDISLRLGAGEILCVVGESGSGKSTLMRSIIGLLPDNGHISNGRILFEGEDISRRARESDGRVAALRGRRIGMIFQNPDASFNPTVRLRKQFREAMRRHLRLGAADADIKAIDMLRVMKLADPEQVLQSYPFQLSGGMRQRAAIAMAMAMEPSLLLADEPTSALDATVQSRVIDRMAWLRDTFGTAIVVVTHNMGVVARLADWVAVMYAGEVVEYGWKDEVLRSPSHPYSSALMAAIPDLRGRRPLTGIPGRPPSFAERPDGCAFSPRCPQASHACRVHRPAVVPVGPSAWTLCSRLRESGGNAIAI